MLPCGRLLHFSGYFFAFYFGRGGDCFNTNTPHQLRPCTRLQYETTRHLLSPISLSINTDENFSENDEHRSAPLCGRLQDVPSLFTCLLLVLVCGARHHVTQHITHCLSLVHLLSPIICAVTPDT